MRLICDLIGDTTPAVGWPEAISLARLPRPCGGFWLIMPARRTLPSAAASLKGCELLNHAGRGAETLNWIAHVRSTKHSRKLAVEDPGQGRVSETPLLRGLSIGRGRRSDRVSPATAKRYWIYARAWLFKEMELGIAGNS